MSFAPIQLLESYQAPYVWTSLDDGEDKFVAQSWYLGPIGTLPSARIFSRSSILVHKEEQQLYKNVGLTGATPVWVPISSYDQWQENGVDVPNRPIANFTYGLNLTDDPINDATIVSVNESELDLALMGGLLDLSTQVTGTLSSSNINLTSLTGNVAVVTDGITILGDGTTGNPLTAIGGGGGGVIGDLVINQTPDNGTYTLLVGAVDGVNKVFNVSTGTYVSGSLLVYLNGIALEQGATEDWFETDPSTGEFEFVTAPASGDIITVSFQSTSGSTLQLGIEFQDEGTPLGSAGTVNEVDFVGSGVTASRTGNKVTVSVTGGGGAGGGAGTKLAINTTQTTVPASSIPTTVYTIPIPANTLGTNDAIRFKIALSNFYVENSEDINVTIQYDGVDISNGGIIFDGLSDGIPQTDAYVEGLLIADNATNAQKSIVTGVSSVRSNPTSQPINTQYDTATVDSTIQKDLTVIITSSGGTNTCNAEAIIVEKISSVQDGITIYATAAEDLTAGDVVGMSNTLTDTVGRYFDSAGVTMTFPVTVGETSYAKIGTDKLVVAYTEQSTTNLYVATLEIDQTDFASYTVGTPVLVTSTFNSSSNFQVAQLDTDKFALLYAQDPNDHISVIVAGTVSGSTITLGTPQNALTTGLTQVGAQAIEELGTDKVIVAVEDTGTVTKVIAITFSGTVATIGTPVTLSSTQFNADNTASKPIAKIDTDKFVIITRLGVTLMHATACTVSGTTITAGTITSIANISTSGIDPVVESHITDGFVVTYQEDTNNPEVVVCTVSGTTITAGTPAGTNNANGYGSIWIESPTSVLIFEGQIAAGDRVSRYSISGTSISFTKLVAQAYYAASGTLVDMGGYFFYGANIRYTIQGMANNTLGIVQNTVSKGGTAVVLVTGISNAHTGLVAGMYYQPVTAGLLTEVSSTSNTFDTPVEKAYLAVSSTKLKI